MQADLDAARKVQHGCCPRAAGGGGYQFFDFYEPANQVGGRFLRLHFAARWPRGGGAGGRFGQRGGGGAGDGQAIGRSALRLASEPSAAKAVDKINESFCRAGWEDRFATFVLALFDPANKSGDDRQRRAHAAVRAAWTERNVEELAPEIAGLPLGVAEGIPYDSAEVTLAPGEMITLFTDGISEALNPANELYTLERLKQQLEMQADSTATLGAPCWTM